MRQITYVFVMGMLILCSGCIIQNQKKAQERKPQVKISVGVHNGGVIENTDLTVVEDVSLDASTGATNGTEPDAYTGATKVGANAGAHVTVPAGQHDFETGIDYLYSSQQFTYNDNINNFTGNRDLNLHQLVVPLTYNLSFFRKKDPYGTFTVKLGYLLQCNLLDVSDHALTLPEYSINRWSHGPVVGFNLTPFQFDDGARFGFSFDIYRGSAIYHDYYNQKDFEMPGSGFMKFGVVYHFSPVN
ncbi:MAG: outer membrane beta-barrel protein [Bacteroidota bacterium]